MGNDKNEYLKNEVLNNTLVCISTILNENNINNWFIGYGTLLGIIRNNSCIDGDDDVDIVIDKTNYNIVKDLLIKKGFEFEYKYGNIGNSKDILKIKTSEQYCTVDFYMASVDGKGNFNDKWEKTIWSNCYDDNNKLIEYIWNDNKLYLPFNYEQKLINRYGENWRIPQKSKGVTPKKLIL
jgi:hypothetical protein